MPILSSSAPRPSPRSPKTRAPSPSGPPSRRGRGGVDSEVVGVGAVATDRWHGLRRGGSRGSDRMRPRRGACAARLSSGPSWRDVGNIPSRIHYPDDYGGHWSGTSRSPRGHSGIRRGEIFPHLLQVRFGCQKRGRNPGEDVGAPSIPEGRACVVCMCFFACVSVRAGRAWANIYVIPRMCVARV